MLSKKLGFRSWANSNYGSLSWSIMYRSRPGSMSHIGGWIGYGSRSWSSCGSITRSKVSITISRSGVIPKYKSI